MSYHIIGDQDTVLGFRFAGITGDVVSTAAEAEKAFRKATGNPAITVLVITEAVEDMLPELVTAHRLSTERPYLTVIQDVWGPRGKRRGLQDMINEAVGIKLSTDDEK